MGKRALCVSVLLPLAIAAHTRATASDLAGIGPSDPRAPVDGNVAPWTAVARLQIPGIDRCTAFLIAPRLAVTAAHCLWGARLGHLMPPQAVHVLSGYHSGAYAQQTVVTSYQIGSGYDPKRPYATLGSDVAVLTLESTLGSNEPLLSLADRPATASTLVTLGGYSQDRAEIILADQNCRISAAMPDDQGASLLRHTCMATHGTSGAPMLTQNQNGTWTVVGVQVAAVRTGSGGIAVPASAIRAVLTNLAKSK
jgi:protease YdgD